MGRSWWWGYKNIDWEDFVAVKWRFQNRQCCRVSPWWEGPTVGEAFEGEGESVKRTKGERKDDRKTCLVHMYPE